MKTSNRAARLINKILVFMVLFSGLLILGCVSISSTGDEQSGASDDQQKQTFEVGDNAVIDVTGFNGEIEIIAGSDGVIDVEATLRTPNKVLYSATQSGNTVTVIAKRTGSIINIGREPAANIHITVPMKATVKARSSNGQITVNGLIGDGELNTSNGRISITKIDGTYVSSTSNGKITMAAVSGQFQAKTSNGSIDFSGSFIENSNNQFSTSNGSISITFDGVPNVDLDAHTSNVAANSALPILATKTEKSHLVGKYGDGSASLVLRTSNGKITIH
ncbi:MAG: DUF4097 family beta strand repeat protein [Chloroflexi bacterium]|nr:DUF4097 family beta strand repeat protein [Chloroflexota bacterium]